MEGVAVGVGAVPLSEHAIRQTNNLWKTAWKTARKRKDQFCGKLRGKGKISFVENCAEKER